MPCCCDRHCWVSAQRERRFGNWGRRGAEMERLRRLWDVEGRWLGAVMLHWRGPTLPGGSALLWLWLGEQWIAWQLDGAE